MENISLHIEYLLLKHDCVIVPGIGAFINAYREARYDRDRDIFLPPASEVRFNSEITEDDGLLANSYSRKYRISFAESRAIVNTESASLRDALLYDREITLGNLGILRLDENEKISFRPFSRMDSINERLGFRPVDMKRPVTEETGADADIVSEDIVEEKPLKQRSLDFERNYYIPVNKIFAKTAACLLLVATIAVSLLLPSSDKVKEDRASVIPVDTIIKTAKSNISNRLAPKESEESQETEQASAEQPAAETAPEEDLPYQLIVGTFASEEEAEAYVETMKKKGYTLRNIPSRRLHRVSAAGSAEASELYTMLNDKEFKQKFSEAWVWHNPSK